jgi:type IV pilus assembly protein PilN
MPRINLLPWREELRKQRQRNFSIAAGVAVALACATVWYSHAYFDSRIDQQRRRNDFLKQEIAAMDERIAQIRDLENTRDRLIARMRIIDRLQRSRPEAVHLMDELVSTLPEGVSLKSVRQTGERILIKGVAQSSTRVSNYMRNLDASPWFQDPGLNIIEVVEGAQGRDTLSEFTLVVTQVTAGTGEEEEAS